ncbi:hypothetical protein AnigIFM63309_000436 [Aspergillus niger]|nr:hypothetical protein AnigIFM50267_007048 [Aspergillus niger]GLA33603.1 hypothetical protein AnigIFM63309_000436 [Aspergillus niger]
MELKVDVKEHGNPLSLGTSIILLSLVLIVLLQWGDTPASQNRLPLINAKRRFEIVDLLAKKRFITNAQELLKAGLEKVRRSQFGATPRVIDHIKASVFNIVTENGVMMVLDPKYADEIRNSKTLSLRKTLIEDMHVNVPGFEQQMQALENDEIFQTTLKTKLTRNLEWHEIPLSRSMLKIIAQLSSRVFLGDKICHNPKWLRVSVDYSIDLFQATFELRIYPRFLRPLASRFQPSCRRLRADIREARSIIEPVIEERRKAKAIAKQEGRDPERHEDTIEWLEEVANGRQYNPVSAQLLLSSAAVHTSSDMLTQVLYDLDGRQELIEALRDEIRSVFKNGWERSSLAKLRLMDSVLKESQRLKPISSVSMRRMAEAPVTLSDGTIIPKDCKIIVPCLRQWDEKYYPDPETFIPDRFLKLRNEPGYEHTAAFANSSPNHLGFGLGRHACPGRFFAANEIKLALCHILMKYEFRVVGKKPEKVVFGTMLAADPNGVIAVRRRKGEEQIRL